MISNTLASVAVPALAMILPSWRYLTCIAIIPIPLVIIGSFFGLVPESLSWLICEGKTEKVQKAAEIVARINGQSLEVTILKMITMHIEISTNTFDSKYSMICN